MPVFFVCAGLLGLLVVVLTVNVGIMRGRKKINLGDGGDPEMIAAIRAHANLIEFAPLSYPFTIVRRPNPTEGAELWVRIEVLTTVGDTRRWIERNLEDVRWYLEDADRGWALLNQLTTLGAIIQVPSFVLFVWNVFASLRNGRPAGADPWDAWTLEWSTPSPPPAYNFAVIPTVHSRRPLWDLKHPDDPDWLYD